jgi:hypothetical protein
MFAVQSLLLSLERAIVSRLLPPQPVNSRSLYRHQTRPSHLCPPELLRARGHELFLPRPPDHAVYSHIELSDPYDIEGIHLATLDASMWPSRPGSAAPLGRGAGRASWFTDTRYARLRSRAQDRGCRMAWCVTTMRVTSFPQCARRSIPASICARLMRPSLKAAGGRGPRASPFLADVLVIGDVLPQERLYIELSHETICGHTIA